VRDPVLASWRRWALAAAAIALLAGAACWLGGRGPAAGPVAPSAASASAPAPAPAAPAASVPAAPVPAPPVPAALARLRALVDSDPAQALALARADEADAPAAPYADERAFLALRALVHLNRITEAHDGAADFFARYPGSPFGARVERLTGMHPRN
jgi:hypothetical protein